MADWTRLGFGYKEECFECECCEDTSLLLDPDDGEKRYVCENHLDDYEFEDAPHVLSPEYRLAAEKVEEKFEMIGCEEVKREIDLLLRRVKGQKKLQESGKIIMKNPTLHMVFTGNPGTGKTEFARKMARKLYSMGYIRQNKIIETDRSGLIGEHVGATAPKVLKRIQEALGGVLFIDEAYAIFSKDEDEGGNQYAHEAVAVLLKAMEDHRDDLVVILAGYGADMQRLLSTNDGFRSRFPYHIKFRDYTPEQIRQIADQMLSSVGYDTSLIQEDLKAAISKAVKGGSISDNARWARNFIEKVTMEHMIRVGEDDHADVTKIFPEDVQRASGLLRTPEEREGLLAVRDAAYEDLSSMVGLAQLKAEMTTMMNFLMVRKMKEEKGIYTATPSLHMSFKGAPGTGKTTVARIMGQFLKGTGILSNGHLVEVTKSDLVSGIAGHTPKKVREFVNKALGGILFIDEAYALAKDKTGREAIDELIKQMEEYRDQLVVIVAGYNKDMERLFDANEGLRSRIPYHFDFPNYTDDELISIADSSFSNSSINMDKKTRNVMLEKMTTMQIHGNGRWVRNFTEKLIMVQSDRIVRENSSNLTLIKCDDIEETFKRIQTTA